MLSRRYLLPLVVSLGTSVAVVACDKGASGIQLQKDASEKAQHVAQRLWGPEHAACDALGDKKRQLSEDSNKVPFQIDCESMQICSAGEDKVHATADDNCESLGASSWRVVGGSVVSYVEVSPDDE